MSRTVTRIDPDIVILARRLGSRRRYVRMAAERALQSAGPETIGSVLVEVARQASRSNRRRRSRVALAAASICCMIAICLAVYIGAIRGWWPPLTPLWKRLLNVFYLPAVYFAVDELFRWEADQCAVNLMTGIEDARVVGPLIEALDSHFEYEHEYSAMEIALLRILPRLTDREAARITDRQRRILCRELKGSPSWLYKPNSATFNLVIVVMELMTRLGEAQALPMIERYASGEVKAVEGTRVQSVAIECLPALRERIAARQVSDTLLRPVEEANLPLVRPAGAPGPAVPEQLLRPGPDTEAA